MEGLIKVYKVKNKKTNELYICYDDIENYKPINNWSSVFLYSVTDDSGNSDLKAFNDSIFKDYEIIETWWEEE